jgi:hypothetical protein
VRGLSASASEAIPLIEPGLPPASFKKVVRQLGEYLKRFSQIAGRFPKNDLVTSPKDFHFAGAEAKLARNPYGLGVATAKDPSSCHFLKYLRE